MSARDFFRDRGAPALAPFPRGYQEAIRWYNTAHRVAPDDVDLWWRTAVRTARRSADPSAPVLDVLTQAATVLFDRADVPVHQLQHVPMAVVGGMVLTHREPQRTWDYEHIEERIDASYGSGTSARLRACSGHYRVLPWPNCYHNLRLILPTVSAMSSHDVEVVGALLYRFDRAGVYDVICAEQLRAGLRSLGVSDEELQLLERCVSPYPSVRDRVAAEFVVRRTAFHGAEPCGGALIVAAALLSRTEQGRITGELLTRTQLTFPEAFEAARALAID